jgi:hypothetical protein
LEFVQTKSNELKSKLDQLVPTNIIKGTFKAQIIFDCKSNFEQVIGKLKIKCENTKYEIPCLYLYVDQNKNKFEKLIVIASFDGQYPSIIQQIQEEVYQYFQDFIIEDIQIKSSIENEGLPINDIDKQLFWNEKIFSFQFHYQILIKKKLFPIIQYQLASISRFNSYLSAYIIKRIDNRTFHYIIQMSLSDVGRDKALMMSDEFFNFLKRNIRRSIMKIQREFTLYGKNIDLLKMKDI